MASSKPIRRVKSRDLSEVPDQSKSNDGVKLQDKYEMYSIPDNSNGEFLSIRTIGGLVATKTHWVMLETKEGKQVSVPKACLNFDVEEQCINEDNGCPYCKAEQWFKDHEVTAKDRNGRESNPCRSAVEHVTNAIVRDLQEDIVPRVTLAEEKETGIINKGSKSKTPVRVIRLTGGVVSKFKDVEKLNVHKVKTKTGEERRSMPISHAKYGRDVLIKFNPKAKSASEYYGVQGGDKSPLTKEELALLKWDIEAWPFENEAESKKDADSEIMRLKGKHWDKFRKHAGVKDQSDDYDDEDDEDYEDEYDDEDEDERPAKKGKGKAASKSKGKSKSRRDEDEDEDEDDDFDDMDEDDEDEDERPSKKGKKAPAKGKGKSNRKDEDEEDEDDDLDDEDDEDEDFDDEDDEDEDDDFDDEDEDDEPPRKSKSKKAPAKGKGKSRRDEDDEDEDDDLDDEDDDFDDEDEDDEPPAKKKGSASKTSGKKSSKKRQDDDEDEDDDLDDLDDDEDEDDEPPRKSKSKKAPAKGKGKSRRDEDDEDEDLDDEDEDDEPPRKSSKKAPAKGKGKAKSRRGADEDEDDDLPF